MATGKVRYYEELISKMASVRLRERGVGENVSWVATLAQLSCC